MLQKWTCRNCNISNIFNFYGINGTKPAFAIAEIAAYIAKSSVRFSALYVLRWWLEPTTAHFLNDTAAIGFS
jgi:hypothetical protein